MSEQLNLITTEQGIDDLIQYLIDKEFIAFDTETNGLEKESVIIGMSVAAEIDKGFYLILYRWNKELNKLVPEPILEKSKKLVEFLAAKSLIMHNAVFDCYMVENNYGVKLIDSIHTDTMILGHLLDENRHNGLKELGTSIFGQDAAKEQKEMKESVIANGGQLTKKNFEMYKADSELMGKYGAKDALLTISLFYHMVPELYEKGLDKFFYEDECMPLLKGPTYSLNTSGLRIDYDKMITLKKQLETESLEIKAFIYREINHLVKDKYPATSEKTTFNIDSNEQLSWLLFIKLNNEFGTLTKGGKALCKKLNIKIPYSFSAKSDFISMCTQNKDKVYEEASIDKKTLKSKRLKKIGDPWKYLCCTKSTLDKLAHKYKWVEKLLIYKKNRKLLSTYIEGIEERIKYNIIRPSFLQHGTTSGRYSSKNPNFQNLPRDEKRIKSFVVSRPGNVFIGADYSQLEPRVFASISGDKKLLESFKKGEDFYSVIGMEVFEKYDCSLIKNDGNSFANIYPEYRNIAKTIALSATYGTTPYKMSPLINKNVEDSQEIINNYFEKFPNIKKMMLKAHQDAKSNGIIYSSFGRPRRMPAALNIPKIYGSTPHSELPYEMRNLLNLAVNHTIQSTAASIMNRAAIACWNKIVLYAKSDERWYKVKIIMQVHDELILEGPEELGPQIIEILKDSMENTVILPGVDLKADPKIAKNLADLK